MAEFKFKCPHCARSLNAPEEKLRGQQKICPSCKRTIKLPDRQSENLRPSSSIPEEEYNPPIPPLFSTPSPPQSVTPSPNSDPGPAAPAAAFPKILTVLIVIAVIVGAFYVYRKVKAEAPFFVAAKEALDEVHKMQSALGVGITYIKYGDELIVVATKVDNVLRIAENTGIENLEPNAKVFCQKLGEVREAYRSASEWWGKKINIGAIPEYEKNLQEEWHKASQATDEADRVFSKL